MAHDLTGHGTADYQGKATDIGKTVGAICTTRREAFAAISSRGALQRSTGSWE
ncbi:MAG TPA: hypothetical protein VHQ87_18070 [Rhizobacter sp.]|nr:hypothetical protein [Rhizobacter sp.]